MSDTECPHCHWPKQDRCCYASTADTISTLRTELEQARAEAERYRVALEQYADLKNWQAENIETSPDEADEVVLVAARYAYDPDEILIWDGDGNGPHLARTALSKEADGE